jgi:hypothetical protein
MNVQRSGWVYGLTLHEGAKEVAVIQPDPRDGWDGLVGSLKPADPTEFDVRKLRARVGRELGPIQQRQHSMARSGLAAAAAAVVFGVLGITLLQNGPAVSSSAPRFMRGDDGSIQIDFNGNQGPHRVSISSDPLSSDADPVTVARGQQFVDRTEQPAPGSVVFYRID